MCMTTIIKTLTINVMLKPSNRSLKILLNILWNKLTILPFK